MAVWDTIKGGFTSAGNLVRSKYFTKAGKIGLITGGIAGGITAIAGIGLWAASAARNSRRPQPYNADRDIDAQLAQTQAILAQQAMLASGPADGRAADEWQRRIRGGQQQVSLNPKQSVVSEDSVQPIGPAL